MTNFKRKLTTAIATGAILVNSLTPLAFADTTIEISGNTGPATNTANVTTTQSTTVVQSNVASVINTVTTSASTGGNSASRNAGGDVEIETGDATTKVDVSTKANLNQADVNNCGACDGDTKVNISGNSNDSDNTVKLNTTSDTNVFQNNDSFVSNLVVADAKTGNNDANRNAGGDVKIDTGDAKVDVKVKTATNANIAQVGGNGDGRNSIDAIISGNSNDGDNKIKLNISRPVLVVQDNIATIINTVIADAKTGKNDANRNAGGDVEIETGNADVKVVVDNMANFNAADVSCDCLLGDIKAKISGNTNDDDNKIKARLSGDITVFQGGREGEGNNALLDTLVTGDAKTGKNDANRNAGEVDSDPSVDTGDAYSETKVSNSVNANIFGPLKKIKLPQGVSFEFNFDLGSLFGSINLG